MSGRFDDPEEQYEPVHDLSVLHRWELLHMIWQPIALGASGRVLSVLFRVLPPGRTLRMSMSAVAREAAVDKRTVARIYKEQRASGILVSAATDGKPTVNYSKALDAAIRSVVSRPDGERDRRLARLQVIAEALGTSVNMKFIDSKLAEYEADPAKRLPGRQTRKKNPKRWQLVTDQGQLVTDRGHVATAPGTPCHPELNLNWIPELEEVNGPPEGAAARRSGRPDARNLRSLYGGKPVLRERLFDLMQSRRCGWPWQRGDVAAELGVRPVQAGRVLRELCDLGLAERIDHGRYILTWVPDGSRNWKDRTNASHDSSDRRRC
jgi:hypothetical protein